MDTTLKTKIIIGTRGSALALWQAEWVKAGLEKLSAGLQVELRKIRTTGDKILDVPLAKVGGKGLFVKEIEEALLEGRADIAVHSIKDVPTDFPPGLDLAVICEREDPRDAFISAIRDGQFTAKSFRVLPLGARIGTSSLRRSSQLLNKRPDLKIEQLRGNLNTRLKKLDEGHFDAIILAVAGVRRLGWQDRITEILPLEISLPAVGQGAVGIESRIDDKIINSLISQLNHTESAICVKAERAVLKRLEGGCQVPIAAYAGLLNGIITIDGLVGSVTGDRIVRSHIEGSPDHAESLGLRLAENLLARGAKEILDQVYGRDIPPINGDIGS